MPKVINNKTNQLEDRSYDTLQSDLQSGEYSFRKGTNVNLLDPEGNPTNLPAEQAYKAVKEGFQFPTQDLVNQTLKEAKLQSEFGEGAGNMAKAGLAGAARGLSFGLSDQALTKSGAVSPETLSELQKRNPVSSAVGEGAGVAAGLLTGGGEASAGAKAAFNLPKLLAKTTGSIAEAPAVAKILTKYGAAAAGSAIEGAAYSAGHVVSEQALGDPDLNAQKALSEIGMGALLGGSLGGLLKGAEIGVPKAVNAAKEALDGSGIQSAAAKGYAKASSLVSGKPVDQILSAFNNRAEMISKEELGGLASDFTKSFNNQYNAVNKAVKETFDTVRGSETNALIDKGFTQGAQSEFSNVQSKIDNAINEIRSNPALYPERYAIKLEGFNKELLKADLQEPAQIFQKIDEFKHLMDTQLKFGKMIPPELADTMSLMKNLRGELKASLENETVFGPAGARQAAFNSSYSEFMALQKQVQKDFMTKSIDRSGNIVYKPDPKKIQRGLMDELKRGNLEEYQNASKSLLDQVEKSYQTLPNRAFDKSSIESVIQKNMDHQARIGQHLQFNQDLSGLSAQGSGGETAAVFAAAHMAGLPGAPIAATYDLLRNPGLTVQRLAALEKTFKAAGEKLSKATSAVFGKTPLRTAKAVALSESDFDSKSEKIQKFSTDPEYLLNHLSKSTSSYNDYAPDTTNAIHQATSTAVNFLASKVPQSAPAGPLDSAPEISRADKLKFLNYYNIVQNPMLALEQVKNGTLKTETIETLNAVYPKLYEEMKTQLTEKIADRKPSSIPYSTKMMLNMFFGQPLNNTLEPQSIQANQSAYSMGTQVSNQMQPHGKVTQGGLKKLDGASRLTTPMNKALTRTTK